MKVLLFGRWLANPEHAFRAHEVTSVSPFALELDPGNHVWASMQQPCSCWFESCPRASEFDLMIAFPPCQFLCASGLHWNMRVPGRQARTDAAVDLVRRLMALPIPRIAIENPVGCISSQIRKPDQIIQPYDFGHDASKRTCLWLKGLPALVPTKSVPPRIVNGKPRWANQFDSGQNNQINAPDRSQARAERWPGIMEAMEQQWAT